MSRRIVWLILLVVIIGACASTAPSRLSFVQHWQGKSAQEVMDHFGPPVQVMADGQGGQMLLYGPGTRTYSLGDFQRQGSYFRGHDLDHIFWVNSQATVYRVWTRKRGELVVR